MKPQNKTLPLYFSLVLSTTWIISFSPILLGFSHTLPGTIVFLLGAASPSVLGLVFVLRTYNKQQRRNYFLRCFTVNRRVLASMAWTLAYFAGLALLLIWVGGSFFHMEMPGFALLKLIGEKPYFVLFWLLNCYISGSLNEEYGWRGYALDHLLVRFGYFKSSLLLGFIWAIWHLPWFFMPGQAQYIGLRAGQPLLYIASFLLSTMGLSCIITLAYIRTHRKVVSCIFIHMMSNGILFGLLLPFPTESMYTLAHSLQILGAACLTLYALLSKQVHKETRQVAQAIDAEFS